MSLRRFLNHTRGRKDKPPKAKDPNSHATIMPPPTPRFLEPFYKDEDSNCPLDDTKFFDHFGDDNIPFGIASSPNHPLPAVAVRHNDLVFFIAGLAKEGYLPSLKQIVLETLKEVSSIRETL